MTFPVTLTTRLEFSGYRQDLLQADGAAGLQGILCSRRGLGGPDLHQHGPARAQVRVTFRCVYVCVYVQSLRSGHPCRAAGLFKPDLPGHNV